MLGATVVEATSFTDAKQYLRGGPVDLVFLDLHSACLLSALTAAAPFYRPYPCCPSLLLAPFQCHMKAVFRC